MTPKDTSGRNSARNQKHAGAIKETCARPILTAVLKPKVRLRAKADVVGKDPDVLTKAKSELETKAEWKPKAKKIISDTKRKVGLKVRVDAQIRRTGEGLITTEKVDRLFRTLYKAQLKERRIGISIMT